MYYENIMSWSSKVYMMVAVLLLQYNVYIILYICSRLLFTFVLLLPGVSNYSTGHETFSGLLNMLNERILVNAKSLLYKRFRIEEKAFPQNLRVSEFVAYYMFIAVHCVFSSLINR